MRITGGHHRGRRLTTPATSDIRPASDKIRQAVFNMLLPYDLPTGARVLDLFCGTGAYGLDALSREAVHCDFVDKGAEALALVKNNIKTLEMQDCTNIHRHDACNFSPSEQSEHYDLIFIDPPYGEGLAIRTLDHLKNSAALQKDTIIVLETEKNLDINGYDIMKDKTYGRSQIRFLRSTL